MNFAGNGTGEKKINTKATTTSEQEEIVALLF